MNPELEWQFGGWLRAWPAAAAWSLLATVAVTGLWLVIRSYRGTPHRLGARVRFALAAIRGGLLLVLLLCLSNPTRIVRNQPENSKRELAVLVDRSASMSLPDFRGATRLASAVRLWKEQEADAAKAFTGVKYSRFAGGLEPAASFAEAAKASEPGAETHFYAALRQALDQHPAAIVCLTDGLDTTAEKTAEFMAQAAERGVPLYFAVGDNQMHASGESLRIREVKVPAKVLRQSRFTASMLVEAVTPAARDVALELWSGTVKLASTNIALRPGFSLESWQAEVTAGEPALMPLEFRAGAGTQQQMAASTTRVVENTTVELLLYQGALQWGYRFLRDSLGSDPSFRLTTILNPALGLQMATGIAGQPTLVDLPEDARELKRFQIIVLAHAFADMLTPKQQQALLAYARGGGGVLFISPDTEATRYFSGTALEQMLPVVFEAPGSETSEERAERQFQAQMRSSAGSAAESESLSADAAVGQRMQVTLTPFRLASGSAAARLFRSGANVPQFNTYARVRKLKPGAAGLAVHPTDTSPQDNSPRVLVARQQFGDGFTAVMNTDLLWRWKLSLPSTNRAPEIFWQQFLLSLAQPAPGQHLELADRTDSPQMNRPVTLRLSGVTGDPPALVVRSPQGEQRRLTVSQADAADPGVWQASFTPETEGRWQARASVAQGDEATLSVLVAARGESLELSGGAPNIDALRQLTEATGGAILEHGTRVFDQQSRRRRPAEVVRTQALWHQRWLAMLLLVAYAAELLARRAFKLL